jgi:DNA (cytosine-5)-methyltransferase 1
MNMIKHLDLFTGIGGFTLAAQFSGMKTVAQCEIDSECRKVLNKHWPKLPKHKDIRELNGEDYTGIDLITGGYPCQPFSIAGKQKAHEDDRHLWPEMHRIITQAKPTWIICENVYGHVTLGLDEVLADLEAGGYTSQSFIVPSMANGANHRRNRVYIVAYAAGNGRNESETCTSNGKDNDKRGKEEQDESRDNERCRSLRPEMDGYSLPTGRRGTKPPSLRVDDELPRRMDRNRMLGNAIDPMIAYQLMTAINEY